MGLIFERYVDIIQPLSLPLTHLSFSFPHTSPKFSLLVVEIYFNAKLNPALLTTRTSQLLSVKTGARRYVDTGVLIRDFTSFPFNSERHAKALARMNWLHSRYKISNDDMLYTLSVFVTSPDKWLGLYDWRGLTELEVSVITPVVPLSPFPVRFAFCWGSLWVSPVIMGKSSCLGLGFSIEVFCAVALSLQSALTPFMFLLQIISSFIF